MTNAVDLLKSLGLGTQRTGNNAATATLGGMNFAEMLSKATGGVLSSGLEVSVAPGANIELSAEQLQRLAQVADSAQAQGASRVLVLMDGQALTMDVGVRQVLGTADMTGMVTGIDAVVAAPGNGTAAATAAIGPRTAPTNASLLNALASIVRGG